ncbi:MAG: FAD:protein FMN transferase [Mogibacterium sp.]|nr:FAD:protein FMN transferase [Mogibacterium sp.]
MKRALKKLNILVLAAVLIILAGCSGAGGSAHEPVMEDGYYLDTICSVSIYRMTDPEGEVKPADEMSEEAEAALSEAFDLCKDLESKLSRTHKDSDISRLNSAGGEWVEVSEDTRELIQKGMEYSYTSDGGFDITVGGVTELWDFHAAEGEAQIPDAEDLAEAVKHINYRNIAIEGKRVRLTDPETKLDLGGIAKGYIGDRMTELLESKGVVSAVINLGGNVICIGGKTDEEGFAIGVEAPFSDRKEIIGKIVVKDRTLVTSGVYERQIEVNGKKYHHILDTATGWPVSTDLDAVTLIADKGRSGDIDALSTTCLIKGADEGMKFIEMQDGIEGVFVLSNGDIRTTDGAGLEAVK